MTDALMDQASEAKRTALGTLLIERGYIDQEQLDEALRLSAENGERLGEVIVRQGWASEDDLAKVLAEQWHLRYYERSAISFDGKALRRMSWEDASRLEALPIHENEDGAVVVAVAEPTDARLLALRELLGDRIDFVVVAKTAIETGLGSGLLAKEGRSVEAASPVETDETVEPAAESDSQFEAYEAMATTSPFETTDTVESGPVLSVVETPRGDEPGADDFDQVARTLADGLTSQLASLRDIVVEAERRRETDRQEIERLHGEVARVQGEFERVQGEFERVQGSVAERDETIRSMQQTLREFADSLDRNSSF
jgi:hypothetical protein